ncbi:DUF6497 family protein [Albidovulum inexpectatum]|uniref:DUF6497 family protein n=1 Tax=Albidovulum inexpectatum TaxID=196587 RepID=UPI001FECA7D7|nr:DUF6497 family protein [Albidovulum inexpectatum]
MKWTCGTSWVIGLGLCVVSAGSAGATEERVVTPSGLNAELFEVIRSSPGTQGLTIRFRFVAPKLPSIGVVQALSDMEWLCETYAVPRLPSIGPSPAQVVISLSDRPLPFGETDPQATQYFDAFTIDREECRWEPF